MEAHEIVLVTIASVAENVSCVLNYNDTNGMVLFVFFTKRKLFFTKM